MKFVLFTLLFIFTACSELSFRTPAAVTRHVVFDIDWTIVSEIKNPSPKDLKNPRVIEVQSHFYYIHDGLEEFIEDIVKKGDVKISFYSGGEWERNRELLSKIKLKNNQSLLDTAYKIKNREDLVSVENPPANARFAERYKKDLRKISKELDELIMFDDTADFVIEDVVNQNKHVFHIGKAFEYFDSFQAARGKSGEYVPNTVDEWLLNREKLNVLHMAFNEAYMEAQSKGVSFSEAMKKREELLNLKDHQWNAYSSRYYKQFKGMQVPSYSIKTGLHDCRSLALEVMLNGR
jgi:hypothetical protein